MDSQKRINEIEKELAKTIHHMMELRKEIEFLTPSSFKFSGKFIKHAEKGYMYVASQNSWENKIWLTGFTFKYSASPYFKNFHMSSDTYTEWEFDRYNLESDLRHGKIKELSKDEFVNHIHEDLSNYTKSFEQALEKCAEKPKLNDEI